MKPYGGQQVLGLLLQFSFVSLTTGSCKLVTTGSTTSVAGDTTDLLCNLVNRKSFDKLRDCLKVSVTSAGELDIVNDISL